MRPSEPRPPTAGPDSGTIPPFPLRVSGPVVAGFGRGSRELGIPTANIPLTGLSVGGCEDVESGVYYGWCGLGPLPADGDKKENVAAEEKAETPENAKGTDPGDCVYPMVMSIGWNPYYKNTVRSVEVHIMHSFPSDFYGAPLKLLILGYIRPEYDYVSKEALIEDINIDIEVAKRSLDRDGYKALRDDAWLQEF